MLNNLIIDNFFEDPDEIRKIALSRNYRYGNDNRGRPGWRGERTLPIRSLDTICPCCNQEINSDFYSEQKLLLEYSKKILDACRNHFKFNQCNDEDFAITSYFHITTEETIKSLPFFSQDKFHQDNLGPVAGIVYLTPNAPPNSGTSILDAEKNQFVDVENIYNRLVAYNSYRIHGLSDTFGTTRETGRLTFTFFIHNSMDFLYYD
jgi:hypothetical protein